MPNEIICCPKCKKSVEARDYMNSPIVGFLGAMPRMECTCGYRGLPIKLNIDEYKKWAKG